MSQFFASGGQSIGVSVSASVLPIKIQDRLPLGYTGWLSLLSKGLSKNLPQTHSSKASILQCSAFFIVQLSHPYMTTGKTIALTRWTFVGKVMCLLFNMLSRLVIAFFSRSKHFFFNFVAAITICIDFQFSSLILEPHKNKVSHSPHLFATRKKYIQCLSYVKTYDKNMRVTVSVLKEISFYRGERRVSRC